MSGTPRRAPGLSRLFVASLGALLVSGGCTSRCPCPSRPYATASVVPPTVVDTHRESRARIEAELEQSKKKESAYLYCQWAVSKLMGARLMQAGGGVPFRDSILGDAESRAGVKMPPAWIDAVVGSGKISRLGLPVIQPVPEFRDVIGIALTNLLSGGDAAAELKKATEQFKPVLEKSETA